MPKIIPCRVTYQGHRYEVRADGTVIPCRPMDVAFSEPAEPVSADFAAAIRKDAARQRRNRQRRERDGALRSLGMIKTPYGWE
jgi:hypothetical protein